MLLRRYAPSPLSARVVVLGVAALSLCSTASAQKAEAAHARVLAASCAACHGTDGRPAPDSAIPGLAGLSADYLASQMRAFRDGTRAATVMHQIAKGYSLEQIDALAAYFANHK